MSQVTPMMQQYLDIKSQYKDAIMFFRLGDFYEMFFEDAVIASKELEITLTGRDCGLTERAPMCGVPFHSAENYISRLIGKGHKVAICEQVEDPQTAKGIVRRDVIRVVTPGTLVETSMLDEKKNNYLMSIYKDIAIGIAIVDISTGELLCSQIEVGNIHAKLMDEIAKIAPTEVIANEGFFQSEDLRQTIQSKYQLYFSSDKYLRFDYDFGEQMIRSHLESAHNFEKKAWIPAVGALLQYLERTQKVNLQHIKTFTEYAVENYMLIDAASRRNLELCETMREKSRKGSLLWVLDKTVTSMGARNIRKWLEQPLLNIQDIRDRQEGIEELKGKFMIRSELRECLQKVFDMERIIGKVILGNANARDLISLKSSLKNIPTIKEILFSSQSSILTALNSNLDSLQDIFGLLDVSIVEEPPFSVREGGIIKLGYHAEVDSLRTASSQGKDWIAALEASEKEKTGIKNLKIGFNKVFGYYIEVTKSYFNQVPAYFIRKQTLANCERYITDELKKIEDSVLGAEEKIIELEYQLFIHIKDQIIQSSQRILSTAQSLAVIDTLAALSEVADRENYIRPEVTLQGEIQIIEGRHPVVEKMLGKEGFVPNDIFVDSDENRLLVITGPNMAGKSTYMRQTALIVLMAQIGSFVPAKMATIGLVDRIFTRVGASDDLASGQSTFMVEMSEVANILQNSTQKSLLILDEIGRGTSTFDGLAIAWSVIEFIGNEKRLGARTLFATHYHELTELEGKIEGIKNYCISVMEKGEDIIFLRKIIRGGADGSYGIQVAKLAGLPKIVIDRAKEILRELEDADISRSNGRGKKNTQPLAGQMNLFSIQPPEDMEMEVVENIRMMDISTLTPIDALNVLYNYQKKLRNGG